MPTLYGSFCRVDLADGVLVAMADSTTVRVVPTPDASTRADLAADVARLERAVADLTRECGRLRAQLEAALATMIRRTLRAWDAADAGAEVLPMKRTGSAR